MLAALALALQLQAPADTVLFPPRESLLRLYTNCDEARWPWGTDETFVPKTTDELRAGVARRRALEARWREVFLARAGDSLPATPEGQRAYPLGVRGRLIDNFHQARAGGEHEALDIFVPAEGVAVLSPVTGLVIAAGDHWQGGWRRRGGFYYEGGGLSRRAGNGAIVFEPSTGTYYYLAHLKDSSVVVAAGDLVRAGQPVGRVGHSGNASQPGHGRHLHFAVKHEGTGCSVDGVLIALDPYAWMLPARSRVAAGR